MGPQEDIEVKKELDNIYFEEGEAAQTGKKSKGVVKKILKISVFLVMFAIVGLAIFSGIQAKKNADQPQNQSLSWLNNLGFVGQLTHLAVSSDRKLKGEENDRINILLLGVGGKNHDGGWLTDTIMLLSIQPSTKKMSMISVPRDLTVPIEGMGWRKINAVGAFAEKENSGSGGVAASQAVSKLTNQPIDYYLRVDFDGFAKVIDELGGVDVMVDNQLDDYRYPIRGQEDNPSFYSRYEHLHVEPGLQHMDGSLALKFARSRHGIGGEGSDFARAKRQQKIIEAVKAKLLQGSNLFKPTLITNLITTYQEHVTTNLQVWEMLKLWENYKEIPKTNVINKVLDNSPEGLLTDDRGQDGAYILVPRAGDFSEIQYMVSNVFGTAPAASKEKVTKESATLEIRNGTWVNGLASKVSTDLEPYGFSVVKVGNAGLRNYQRSVIYDLTNGAKSEALALLKERTSANIGTELPSWLTTELNKSASSTKQQPDFILILGQVSDASKSGQVNPN